MDRTHPDSRRVALVTGTSSGFGLRIAVTLAQQGFQVVAGMRDRERQAELVQAGERIGVSDRLDLITLDVTRTDDIDAAVLHTMRQYGRIDVLVNNAGFAVGGFIEEVPLDAWRAQMETNFIGLVAMTKAVLPHMRAQGGGLILQIGSVSGRFGFPGYGAYAASKFAVEGFSESLRHEMAPYGIRVALVEPGAYRTPIWDKGFAGMHAKPDSPHRDAMNAVLAYSRKSAESSPNPQQVADLVARLVERGRLPRLRYPVGRGAKLLTLAGKLLPWRMIESIIRRTLKA